MKTNFTHAILIADFFGSCLDDDIVLIDGGIIDFVEVDGQNGMSSNQTHKTER